VFWRRENEMGIWGIALIALGMEIVEVLGPVDPDMGEEFGSF
jgi:hypothetical protein